MEMKTESKDQKRNDPISQSSSSRCSSITSNSSDGHFDIKHFPLPKPSMSASEAQKQRESHQVYNSSVSSYTGSSWSSVHQNHLADSPGYDPNRIPSSVFSSKPANPMEWSIASNESLFSIHNGNFSISTHGLATTLESGEIPKLEEPVHEITKTNPVKKHTKPEKETITEKIQDQVENSDSENDDEIEEEVAEDVKSTVSHSPSVSCRSDTRNNNIFSLAFGLLPKEDGANKPRPEYLLPLSPMQPVQPELLPYAGSVTGVQLQAHVQPQRLESRTQSFKTWTNGWFSCFNCRSKCGLLK